MHFPLSPGESSTFLELEIRGDTEAELDEVITVTLTHALEGQLGDPLKVTARLTIPANDDPYGLFVVSPAYRHVRVPEEMTGKTGRLAGRQVNRQVGGQVDK